MTFLDDPPDTTFEERLRLELIELHRERLAGGGSAQRRRGRRPLGLSAIAVAAIMVLAASLAVVIAHVASPQSRPTSTAVSAAVVRANLDAALVAAGDDVLVTRETSNTSRCVQSSWIVPFDVQTGADFHEVTTSKCPGGDQNGTGLNLSVRSTARPPLRNEAEDLQQYICGVGTSVGYDTSENESWSASGKTLSITVPATPDLLREAASGGALRVVGSGTVDGQAAIALSRGADSGMAPMVLWISRTTYLPIRESRTFGAGSARTATVLVQDFKFLSPTSPHLALTQLTVPGGLKAVMDPGYLEVPSCTP
jgi:Tfp pilus assembly protein PilX